MSVTQKEIDDAQDILDFLMMYILMFGFGSFLLSIFIGGNNLLDVWPYIYVSIAVLDTCFDFKGRMYS